MSTHRIGFIGAGNMATAIIKGLISNKFNPNTFFIASPSISQTNTYEPLPEINICSSNQSLYDSVDIIILALKPQQLPLLNIDISKNTSKPLIISLLAGITLETLNGYFDEHSIIRTMPNTCSAIQKGMTALHTKTASLPEKEIASHIFQAIGESIWIEKEEDFHAITAISGSGPAYFFYILNTLIEAGTHLNLSKELSTKLVLTTALGAIEMANQPNSDINLLQKNVTSPNGTTAAAISTFTAENLDKTLYKGVQAASNRSKELAKDNAK